MSLWFVYLYVCFNLRDISYTEEALGETRKEEFCFGEDCSHKSDKEEGSTEEGVSASTEPLLLTAEDGSRRHQCLVLDRSWLCPHQVLESELEWGQECALATGSWVVCPDVSTLPPFFLFALRSPATSWLPDVVSRCDLEDFQREQRCRGSNS